VQVGFSAITNIDAAGWDALVAATPGGPDNPFIEHAFLKLLEESGSVGPKTGWVPEHAVVMEGAKLVAACPLYRKTDSYGEYIFDWGWAQSAQSAGIRYYPKYTSAIPFTPATGPRLLGDSRYWPALIEAMLGRGGSGLHALFIPEDQCEIWGQQLSLRASFQFQLYRQPEWAGFEDFLGALTSRRRKEILRERRQVREAGVLVSVKRGEELDPEEWKYLRVFYEDTCGKMGAIPYLSERFFQRLSGLKTVVAVLARRQGRLVAGTLNFTKGKHLYGRYWGCIEEIPALHFECCYYALTEWAFNSGGITRFEAGAQGEHKLSRGFLPVLTHSAHRVYHPGFYQALKPWLIEEARRVEAAVAGYREGSPFKGGGER
jgi:predicted N-acyltransferase